jgi:hypothetical protein
MSLLLKLLKLLAAHAADRAMVNAAMVMARAMKNETIQQIFNDLVSGDLNQQQASIEKLGNIDYYLDDSEDGNILFQDDLNRVVSFLVLLRRSQDVLKLRDAARKALYSLYVNGVRIFKRRQPGDGQAPFYARFIEDILDERLTPETMEKWESIRALKKRYDNDDLIYRGRDKILQAFQRGDYEKGNFFFENDRGEDKPAGMRLFVHIDPLTWEILDIGTWDEFVVDANDTLPVAVMITYKNLPSFDWLPVFHFSDPWTVYPPVLRAMVKEVNKKVQQMAAVGEVFFDDAIETEYDIRQAEEQVALTREILERVVQEFKKSGRSPYDWQRLAQARQEYLQAQRNLRELNLELADGELGNDKDSDGLESRASHRLQIIEGLVDDIIFHLMQHYEGVDINQALFNLISEHLIIVDSNRSARNAAVEILQMLGVQYADPPGGFTDIQLDDIYALAEKIFEASNQLLIIDSVSADDEDDAMQADVATVDLAMKPLGGIDLNPENYRFEGRGEEFEFDIHFNPEILEGITIDGLKPVIIEVVPAVNLPLLLGLGTEGPGPEKTTDREQDRRQPKARLKRIDFFKRS